MGHSSGDRRPVEALIPDELYPSRIGTTDSEAIFLAMMGAGTDNPIAATEKTLATLTDYVGEDRLRFTAALSNGRDLYAFRYAVNDKANTLYYQESESSIVVVSEPLDDDHKKWISVPESHALVALAGEHARIVPMFHRHQQAAE